MPCYRITYNHSAMSPDFVGTAIKHAHTEKEALAFLGSILDKRKPDVRIDKRRSLLTIIKTETL